MPSACSSYLDDIEDIVSQDVNTARPMIHKGVVPHAKRNFNSITPEKEIESNIPGTQTIYVKTWGCTHNSSDSEYMAGQLASYGYNVVTENGEHADLWLLNSCTVKNPAEDHFRNMISKAQSLKKHIVLAGCVAQGAPKQTYMQGLSIIGVQQIDRVVEVVEETLKGNSVRLLKQRKENGKKIGGASLDLPKIRRNPYIEIISINTGCLNSCTYCKTKHARGNLGSYPIAEIVLRAKQSFEEGVVEIWLTSEDTGAYGRDIGTSLPELLWALVEVIPYGCMLRVGMTNPPYILDHLEEMGKILNHPRVYAFLHVPVQSGSNQTLHEMRREYSRADFEQVVDTLRKNVPGISIATDIICGFPTESDEARNILGDFDDTMTLCEKYKFPSLFINQFFPRPGTPAARLPQIHRQEIKKRTKRLSELFRSYEPYGHQLGKIQTVLVTEIAHDQVHYVGHNKYYEQVLIAMDENLMGKMFEVEIVETGKHFLKGKRRSSSIPVKPVIAEPVPLGCVSGDNHKKELNEETIQLSNEDKQNNLLKENHMFFIVIFLAFLLYFILKQFYT
uniref:tRNA-t(6)A37 methylthiotransferase n=1 Tax=Ciona savignyi TaxID=51511 RepID=H2YA80_CIOSA